MQIILNSNEIAEAIAEYVLNKRLLGDRKGKVNMTVTLKTNTETGYTRAIVDEQN